MSWPVAVKMAAIAVAGVNATDSVPAPFEVAMRRLLVAAHVALEHGSLRRHGGVFRDVGLIERIAVPRDHVEPDGVTGGERVHDVTDGSDDVRLDLAQLRVAGEAFDRHACEPGLHLRELGFD